MGNFFSDTIKQYGLNIGLLILIQYDPSHMDHLIWTILHKPTHMGHLI